MFVRVRACLFMFIFICSFSKNLYAEIELAKPLVKKAEQITNDLLEPYLLPKHHPLQSILKEIFKDPHMFKSSARFEKAGFKVKHGHKQLMVGFHPLAPFYLFKKFPDQQSQENQLKNFLLRIRGAQILRDEIQKRHFKHLVVPQKWLYELPKRFSKKDGAKSYILIVENMDICEKEENLELYYNMDIDILTELETLIYVVGGCDAVPRNQPFTHSGKIAFVDTEHLGQKREKFLQDVIPLLNKELQAYAWALWAKLEEEQRAEAHP